MKNTNFLKDFKHECYDLIQSINSWRFWQAIVITAIGVSIFSIGVNGIMIPHKFIATGATGFSLLMYYIFGQPSVGQIYWMINIPILLLGWHVMSLKYVFLSLIGVVFYGVAMDLTRHIVLPIHDPLMTAILGGTITGTGVGLYLRYGGSAGGVDIVATVMRRKWGIPMGTTIITINMINFIGGGLISRNLDTIFYTGISMFVYARMVDTMQTGFQQRKSVLIVTCQPDAIANQIMQRMKRGVTFLQATGGMRQEPTRVIYTVINMIELARLKEIIFTADPNAFMTVSNAAEVIGHRFVSWADAGFGAQPATRIFPMDLPKIKQKLSHWPRVDT